MLLRKKRLERLMLADPARLFTRVSARRVTKERAKVFLETTLRL
jgi:hypothetical protein